ncbi:hypothetical protein QN363_07205 [Undibacterium sp. CCC2.1]|uniref:hypothetical protein n=1 Tax=unclassified Undibacterium TaxID=2630295 RepID=UPI002B22BA8E|nr:MULTISPECIES: hypothetical protein [unclassified Undibacterium]MEB0138808.1 hypothetical protein [Undibacterium sp. CCC2.1]MEB0170716.1 hypothetical protein [Undibacterium sp. CCC1.1]MEB0174605.1 hypothetical protein [Undibacterium sp. CCC3.4]MEB0213802.1 hypothetical protein [Undibacterium sp. 5I2]
MGPFESLRPAPILPLAGRCAASSRISGEPPVRVRDVRRWQRQGVAPPTLSDSQRQRCAREVATTGRATELVLEVLSLARQAELPHASEHAAACSVPVTLFEASAARQSWRDWTASLLAARAAQGVVGTLAGRLVQEGVRVAAGQPSRSDEVDERMLGVGVAVNLALATVAGLRTALHTWRASGQLQRYARGFRGQSNAALLTLATAGTPMLPASSLRRAAASAAAGGAVFMVAAHSGLIALTQLGGQAPNKADLYTALWASNSNASYAYVRELVNAAIDGMGLLPHQAELTLRGGAVSTGQYLVNSLLQCTAQQELRLSADSGFDFRWPFISAAAESIDVATVAAATGCSWSENVLAVRSVGVLGSSQLAVTARPSWLATIERISQRASARQMVAEVSRLIPGEIGVALEGAYGPPAALTARWGGAVLASATHLREHMWQAEAALEH